MSYSLVMTGFSGRWEALHEAAPRILGREGLDAVGLGFFGEQNLPTEIANGLAQDDAERMAADLRGIGASVEVVPSSDVKGVLYRADETWCARVVDGYRFSEIDGMVLTLSTLNVRQHLAEAHRQDRFTTPWEFERGANHTHGSITLPAREQVREQAAHAVHLAAALQKAYPERRFVVSYMPCCAITFWQWSEHAMPADVLKDEPIEGTVWCQPCEGRRAYTEHNGPDAEFPEIEWGTCAVCGTDVIVRAHEVIRIVGPTDGA